MQETPVHAVRPNIVLAVCCTSLLIVGMDVTIVNVALPAIQRELHATLAGLQWIVDAYTLVVASLLMLAGSLSDRFGRRRTFQLGLLLFCAGSLLCSLSRSDAHLIAARALQGVGASMLNPVALSIIATVFVDKRARARAIGIWGAVAGVSLALGPLLGGALTQTLGWRAIFWINLPIGLAAALLAWRFVPESRAPRARAFDPVAQLLLFAGLASLTYAVIEGPRAGWRSPLILGLFAAAFTAVLLFVGYESRRREPLLDLRFFRSLPFASATVLAVTAFSSFAAFLFLNTLYLQQVRGLSAFHAGAATLPLAVAMMISAPLSGRMVGRGGTRSSLLVGGLSFVLSTVLLTRLHAHTPLGLLLLSYALFGVALGMINPAISNNAVSGMPLAQAGVAAAIASTGRQVGAALGIAVAGTIVHTASGHGVGFAQATHPVWWIIAGCGALTVAAGLTADTRWAEDSTRHVAELLGTGEAPAGV